MSNFPFGFNPGSPDDDDKPAQGGGDQPVDPFSALMGGGGDIGAAFSRLGQLLSYQGGPVNWDLARDVARQTVSAAGDRSVATAEREQVLDAMRLADLWLDEVTAFPAGTFAVKAWSRAEWVEATLPAWRELVDPVAGKVVDSMGTMLAGEGGPMAQLGAMPEQAAALAGPLQQMMRSIGGAMFGTQIGQAIGALALEVVGSTDVGLPLAPAGTAALLPANVTAFGAGLEVPADQVRLYLALREAAHQRLFAHVPWLRAHLVDAVAAYARGITVDTARLEEAVGSIDPTDPESLQRALTGGLFEPEDTPEQKAALARLETALALVEGWVDEVVDAAASTQAARGGRAARDRAPAAGRRRAGRGDLRLAGRARAAAAPAARGGRAVAGRARRAGPGRPRGGLGAPGPAADGRRPGRPDRLRHRRLGAAGPLRPRRHRGAARARPAVTAGLHADALRILTSWAAPDGRAGAAALGVRRAPEDPRRRDAAQLRPGAPDRQRAWCSTTPGSGCCSRCTARAASGASSAGTASRRTTRWPPRPCARPPRSPASTGCGWSATPRSTWTGTRCRPPSGPAASTSTCGTPWWRRPGPNRW